MKMWGKPAPIAAGVARAAVAGLARAELVEEAGRLLMASGQADRIGVWLKVGAGSKGGKGASEFRGKVAEQNGQKTPEEWERLTAEALPPELVAAGKTIEQDAESATDGAMLGATVEMRAVMWVPVQGSTSLAGVLFAGSRKKQAQLPRMKPRKYLRFA